MLTQGIIPLAKTQIYTCPSGKRVEIKTIKLHNTAAEDVVVTLFSKTNTSIQTESFLLINGDTIEVSPSYPYTYNTGQGIEAEATVLNAATYIITGRENAI